MLPEFLLAFELDFFVKFIVLVSVLQKKVLLLLLKTILECYSINFSNRLVVQPVS